MLYFNKESNCCNLVYYNNYAATVDLRMNFLTLSLRKEYWISRVGLYSWKFEGRKVDKDSSKILFVVFDE